MTKVAVVVGASIGGLLAGLVLPLVIARAHEDVFVATALLEVMQFLAPPGRLFAPGIMLRLTHR